MGREKDEMHLRFVFVSMLFALTIGKIVEQLTQLVYIGVGFSHPAYIHLLLAAFLVVTSWVGWARSNAPGNVRAVRDVFSWEFVILLIDLFLVLCYFIIVKGAEMPKTKTAIDPSAANETFWILVVFAGYVAWDFVTKAVIRSQLDSTFWSQLCSKYFLRNFGITGSCLGLAILIWILFGGVSSHAGVILVDITLLGLVVIFRLLKQFLGHKSKPTDESLG